MSMVSDSQQLELDEEWIELIEQAKKMGLTTDEVRSFIMEASDLHR